MELTLVCVLWLAQQTLTHLKRVVDSASQNVPWPPWPRQVFLSEVLMSQGKAGQSRLLTRLQTKHDLAAEPLRKAKLRDPEAVLQKTSSDLFFFASYVETALAQTSFRTCNDTKLISVRKQKS